jgi:hypothetical protein
MEIVIKLSDDVYTRLFDNGAETSQSDRMDIETAIRRGVPIVFNADTKTPTERQVRKVDTIPIEKLQWIRGELTKHYVDPYNRRAFQNSTVSLLKVLDLIDAVIGKLQAS